MAYVIDLIGNDYFVCDLACKEALKMDKVIYGK